METEQERKKEFWCKTCMFPIEQRIITGARQWRVSNNKSVEGWLKTVGLCTYCYKTEATHTIYQNDLLAKYIKNRDFCSEQCLQGAILRAIFEHNLTSKRFLSLIIKD